MANSRIAIAAMLINSTPQRIWMALTNPAEVKKILFGTDLKADWKVGGSVTYSGEWQNKKYEDKGVVVEIKPNELLHSTYFSSMSGLADTPENYANVIYRLIPAGEQVMTIVVQDNCRDEQSRDHSEKNWNSVLGLLKELVEKNP